MRKGWSYLIGMFVVALSVFFFSGEALARCHGDDQDVTTYENTSVVITLTGLVSSCVEVPEFICGTPSNGTLGPVGPTSATPDLNDPTLDVCKADVTYTPNPDYNGLDSFTFKIKFCGGDYTEPATVNITVIPVNDPPEAVIDILDINTVINHVEGTMEHTVKFSGERSSDPDGDPLTYLWDFGDGSSPSIENIKEKPTHIYETGLEGDSYTVTLTVTEVGTPDLFSDKDTDTLVFEQSESLYTAWYLAEGATLGTFDEWILIQNPNKDTANITVTYMMEDGSTVDQSFDVGPTSRFSVHVNEVLPDKALGAVVKCTNGLGIVVERAMYWDIPGVDWVGGHCSLGVPNTSPTWYSPEGCTEGFDLYISILNPNEGDTASLRVTFMINDGSTVVRDVNVGPTSRYTIHVNEIVPDAHLSTKVESLNGVEVVVERTMYWNSNDLEWVGGHCSHGVTAPAPVWYLAEGSTQDLDHDFDLWILIQNPNDVPAEVRVTFMKEYGPPEVRDITMLPTSRYTIWVNTILPDHAVSTKVESLNGVEVIASRAMYWDAGTIEWAGGHSFVGVTSTAQTWYLSEGATSGSFDEWVLIQNPTYTNAEIQVTFMKSDGTTEIRNITVVARSRYTLHVNDVVPDEAVSVKVESLNGIGIIVDRAMYWRPDSQGMTTLSDFNLNNIDWIGGHSSIGTN